MISLSKNYFKCLVERVRASESRGGSKSFDLLGNNGTRGSLCSKNSPPKKERKKIPKKRERKVLIKQQELDKKEEKRTKVRVQIIYPNVKSYNSNADALKELSQKGGASLAVKMV